MAVRVGWLLSALTVAGAALLSLVAYLDRDYDMGGLNVAADMGLGFVGVWIYLLVRSRRDLGRVLVAVLVMRIPPEFDGS